MLAKRSPLHKTLVDHVLTFTNWGHDALKRRWMEEMQNMCLAWEDWLYDELGDSGWDEDEPELSQRNIGGRFLMMCVKRGYNHKQAAWRIERQKLLC